MTLDDLQKVLGSLQELDPDVEKFSWGPTYSFAVSRQDEAIRIVKRAIKELKNKQDNSWTGEVDRQGGSFTAEELDPNRGWK